MIVAGSKLFAKQFTFIFCFSFFLLFHVKAQNRLRLNRISEPVKIDGFVNEKAWEKIKPLHMVMYQPLNGTKPTEHSEIKVAYDEDYFYISGKLYDKEGDIRINSLNRDNNTSGDCINWFLTVDFQNFWGFSINAASRRIDAEIRCDAECPTWFNLSWDTFWEGESRITQTGWETEARVPLSSFMFDIEEGISEMGLTVHRLIARKNERITFPSIPPSWENAPFKASLAAKVSLSGIEKKKPVYFSPFLIGGVNQLNRYDEAISGYKKEEKYIKQVGMSLKYVISNNTTLDLSTDFGQTVFDDQRINLTRFSLFYPEKRQFFQQRSGIFTFNTGGVDRLFYSRRIGLDEDWNHVGIYGGARIVSRIKDWDVGLLNIQTKNSVTLPSENFTVSRVRKRVLNKYSYIGSLITNRMDFQGNYNTNLGFDASIRAFKTDIITTTFVQTFQNGIANGFDANHSGLNWQHPARERLIYGFELYYNGKDYNPSIGFIERKNNIRLNQRLGYGWLKGEDSKLLRHGPKLFHETVYNLSFNDVESDMLGYWYEWEMKSGSSFWVGGKVLHENLPDSFAISDKIMIHQGKYMFYNFSGEYRMGDTNLFKLTLFAKVGKFYNGTQFTSNLQTDWIQSKHLTLSTNYDFNHLTFDNKKLLAHIIRIKGSAAFNSKISFNSIVQYNSLDRKIMINNIFRYNFKDGHDLFFVFNEIDNTLNNSQPGDLTRLDNRGFFIKYNYTFIK